MKQKINIKAAIGVLVALTGGAIIAGSGSSLAGNHIMGDMAGFMAGVFIGGYFLIGRAMRVKVPALNYVFIVFGSCFVFFTMAMFITNTPFTGYRAEDYFWIFMMALVNQGISHAMYNWCMGYASSLYVSVFASIDCVFATGFGVLVFREVPTVWQCVGGMIAISGLLYYNYYSQETTIEKSKRNADAV
jgi:drug/metabolite transporter (DMT)-like permease